MSISFAILMLQNHYAKDSHILDLLFLDHSECFLCQISQLLHDIVLLDLAGIDSMLQNTFNDLGNRWTNFNIIVEQLRLVIIARFSIIQNMRKEDNFELIEVECFCDMKQQFIRIMSNVTLCHFMEDFIRFVSESTA